METINRAWTSLHSREHFVPFKILIKKTRIFSAPTNNTAVDTGHSGSTPDCVTSTDTCVYNLLHFCAF
ncbi:hypothetical protein J6590_087185 [Homalodisca vitripennis]|nr:hypothetical protein J6590_087185 [Homalodisca vitripennis]